jgi:ribosomal protein S18 acetylase RimI-like enzyme
VTAPRVEPTVRRLEAGEWQLLRELRLRALRDAPDAFSPRVEDVEREPDAYWQQGAKSSGGDHVDLLVAELAGRPVGLASATCAGAVGYIGAMWVDPTARGSGVGRRLLTAARDALVARGCRRLELTVTETNAAAIALYRSFGFEPTGDWKPLRDGSTLRNLTMACPATTAAGA